MATCLPEPSALDAIPLGGAIFPGDFFLCRLCRVLSYGRNDDIREGGALAAFRMRQEVERRSEGPAVGVQEDGGFLARYFERRALPGALPSFFFVGAMAVPVSYTALFAQQLGYGHAGTFFLIAAVCMTIVRFLGGRCIRRACKSSCFPC